MSNGTATLPFVIPSEAAGSAVCPSDLLNFPYQTPNKIVIPTEAYRSGRKWRDLLFQSSTNRSRMEATPSPLSSRPERSEVEGSAVPRTSLGNVFHHTHTIPKKSAFTLSPPPSSTKVRRL